MVVPASCGSVLSPGRKSSRHSTNDNLASLGRDATIPRGTALSPMNPASHADPHRWKTLSRLYREALERDASERDAFLERACAGDHELRRELDSLLAHGDVIGVLRRRTVRVRQRLVSQAPSQTA